MSQALLISRRSLLVGAVAAGPWLIGPVLAADKGKDKTKDGDKLKDKDKTTEPDQPIKGGGQYGGWGGNVTGGANGKKIEVSNAKELEAALKAGNCTILVKASEIPVDKTITTKAANITIDGQGNTIRGDKLGRETQMLNFEGAKNILIKNVRLRNGGDNVQFKGATDVCLHHVSSTGSGDDGIAFAYGSKNGTISHCFIGGCTRSIFLKYAGTNRITVHHTIIMKHWERGPLIDGVKEYDFRNNLIMDWKDYGTCSMPNANGNIMGNVYLLHDYAKGKKDSAINTASGKVYVKDNAFKNCTAKPTVKSTLSEPISSPEIVPAYITDMDKLEKLLMSDTDGAGCMPRDTVDKAYFAAKEWTVNHDIPFRIPKSGDPLPK